jgi:hypothetical protein
MCSYSLTRSADPLRAALERREPRCRICRDEDVRILVNELLDWRGVPAYFGTGKAHVVTYTDILRELEPANKGRDKKNRITYSSLRVHAKRHYELAGIMDYWEARVEKEMKDVLGITFADLLNGHQQVPLSTKNSPSTRTSFDTDVVCR